MSLVKDLQQCSSEGAIEDTSPMTLEKAMRVLAKENFESRDKAGRLQASKEAALLMVFNPNNSLFRCNVGYKVWNEVEGRTFHVLEVFVGADAESLLERTREFLIDHLGLTTQEKNDD